MKYKIGDIVTVKDRDCHMSGDMWYKCKLFNLSVPVFHCDILQASYNGVEYFDIPKTYSWFKWDQIVEGVTV
jgi:hypothetical protein